MCYSALVEASWRKYVRLTGAELDFPQFVDIFGERAAGAKIAVPRAIERWFDEPCSLRERQIAQLVQQHRAGMITSLEQDLFKQKRRLADAERKLAIKETKAAAESKRIACDKVGKLVEKLNALQDHRPSPTDARIFPMHYAPIVVDDNGRRVVRLARYHCRLADEPASIDQKYPGLYNARRDNIERYWGAAFGARHALLLVTSFYENVERDGKNSVLHFIPDPQDVMLVACLYAEWKDSVTGQRLLSFAAITDAPPQEVAAAGHDRMIINIKPENVARWLAPAGISRAQLQGILSDQQRPYYEHEVLAA